MPDIKRVTKRLEIHCDLSLVALSADQARVAGDRWLNQHESNPYEWNYETTYLSTMPDESWVIVYVQ